MTTKTFTHFLEWSSGKGHTPCTQEYLEAMNVRRKIEANYGDPVALTTYTRADYEAWHDAQSKLDDLRLAGHLGKGVAF
jgi:hypothetical protein